MTEREKNTLSTEIEAALKKIAAEIQLLTVSLRPQAQDCSLEALTKSELIGEANRMIERMDALQTRHKKLEQALLHIKDEGFGLCESCGEAIPFERLLLMPETTCCVICLREKSCHPG